MITKEHILIGWFLVGLVGVTAVGEEKTADTRGLLFSYFVKNGQDGLHLATSEDGLTWTALNGGKSLLQPRVGESKLMRDPSITRGPDGIFHMVRIGDTWYCYWDKYTRGRYGAATSKDLKNWTDISHKVRFPPGTRHGTAFHAPRRVIDSLRTLTRPS